MRKFTLSFLLVLALSYPVLAQYGNEWIDFSQDYYKILTAEDGLYRLYYDDLAASGFPVSTVDPRRIQIFHRGVEQAIYVEGQSDGVFNTGDYLEFYGEVNDGTLDADLYTDEDDQLNPEYNLFSDTTAYFLTVDFSALGKRMAASSEINVSNLAAETYHYAEVWQHMSTAYAPGTLVSDYLTASSYGAGEGWVSALIRNGGSLDFTLSGFSPVATTGGNPILSLKMAGRGSMSHNVDVYVGASTSALRLLATAEFTGYGTYTIEESLDVSDVASDGTIVVRVVTNGVDGNTDRISVASIYARMPQTFAGDTGDAKFYLLEANTTGKSYIEVSDFTAGALLLDVTSPDAPIRIRTVEGTVLKALVPSTTTERRLLLTATPMTPSIEPVTFREIDPAEAGYVIISHSTLMQAAGSYSDVVRAYGAYRASEAGGSYDTLVLDIAQVYNQFNYGEISPRAIRKLMAYLINSRTPDYLFLIGKGLDLTYNYYRNPTATKFATYKSLVPAASYPASDAYYTAGLGDTEYEPAVPTGRITALTAAQVSAYLNKVIEMEAQSYDALWRKNLLHLSGGIYTNEPKTFKGYMEDFAEIAEGNYLGGEVTALAKQSTDIELVNISDEVNEGLNLITFFGHSSPGTIDFDIGFVTDEELGYDNQGRYPMFLINGCNAGSFFLTKKLFGEDWINAENKGAIGFIAHTSYGLVSTLRRYSQYFYSVGYGDSTYIHQGIGDIQKEVAKQYMDVSPSSVAHVAQVQQMLLLGDPAVALFGANLPDYAIDDTSLSVTSFDDGDVTAVSDSFAIEIIVKNYGRTREDSLHIQITRSFSDDETAVVYDSLFEQTVLYQDTLVFVIRKDQEEGYGTNTFTVTIDPNSQLAEITKDNNTATIAYFIPLNQTKNLYPIEYGIVHEQSVNLRFQTTDLQSASREFLLELDTVNTFDSPYKQSFTLSGTVLALQGVTLLDQDSLAYYWRTKLAEPLAGEGESWINSSFSYIADSPDGWAQIHFPQYLNNDTEGLVMDSVLRTLGFEETTTSVAIENFGSAYGASNLDISVKINGSEYQLASTAVTQRIPCRVNTINILAFDKVTTVPYAAIPFVFGDRRTCGKEPQVIGSYRTTELDTSGEGLPDYIDEIAAGDSVVLFSIGDAGYASWSTAVRTALGNVGISTAQLDALEDGAPVVIFGRKGAAAGSAIVYTATESPADEQALQVEGTITGRYTEGDMTSVAIGPATAWQQALYQKREVEDHDQVVVSLIGVALDGTETVLMEDMAADVSLTDMDADTYPYMKLNFYTADDLNLTASQLRQWMVLYTPVAEGVLFYEGTAAADTLIEGETWTGAYGFVNIFDQSFSEDLLVRMSVYNKATSDEEVLSQYITAPDPGDTTRFSFTVETIDKGGLNNVSAYVNPAIVPEQYYDNNLLVLTDYLVVEADAYNPVLEVTIDGRVVASGDYVSDNPKIKIRLWDDNRYILKTDTTNISILLKYPCETDDCDFTPIYFSRDDVSWEAATSTTDFTAWFLPQDLDTGTYVLQVQAADGKGNVAGNEPYEISFVIADDAVAQLLPPYPNPSNNYVVFKLSFAGITTPDRLQLQVYGVEGQPVRTMVEEDNLFIGTNEVVWDGLDDRGNRLPPGIYFYRLTVQTNGQEVPLTIPSGFVFYRNGYGKLVLTR